MFNKFRSFDYISDFTMDSTYDVTNVALNKEVLWYVDQINY
jgi:hypothetical protein